MSLPTKEEWEALGFLVHPDLCSKTTQINELTHTPGPWDMNAIYKKDKLTHLGEKLTHWGINGGKQPWHGRIVDVPRFTPNHDCPTQEANARLISAAPDLLAALEATLEALHNFTTGRIHHPTTVPEVEQMARAAIAKAEGKA